MNLNILNKKITKNRENLEKKRKKPNRFGGEGRFGLRTVLRRMDRPKPHSLTVDCGQNFRENGHGIFLILNFRNLEKYSTYLVIYGLTARCKVFFKNIFYTAFALPCCWGRPDFWWNEYWLDSDLISRLFEIFEKLKILMAILLSVKNDPYR